MLFPQCSKPVPLANRVPFRFDISSKTGQGMSSAEERASQMNKRKLGKTGLEISPLVFGGNVFGWTVDQATSFKLLDAFVDAGFNSVDTADVYSKWMPGHTGGGKKGLSKSHILRSAEDSLRRLQTDYIDLYQSHIDDPDTPMEVTLGAYAELIKQGKARAIGASNHKAERLAT